MYHALRMSESSGEGILVKGADLRRSSRHEVRVARAREVAPSVSFGVRPRRAGGCDRCTRALPRRSSPDELAVDRRGSGASVPADEPLRSATIAAARRAGLAPGAFVVGLVAGIPALVSRHSREEHLAALVASNAQMAALTRHLGRLAILSGTWRSAVWWPSRSSNRRSHAWPPCPC